MRELRDQPLNLKLADGSHIDASLAAMGDISLGEGLRGSIKCHHWNWATGTEPLLWVGRIEATLPAGGNLLLTERTDTTIDTGKKGYRLDGGYTWYILHHKANELRVVVDPGASKVRARRGPC